MGAAALVVSLTAAMAWADGPITVGSLLKEMVDREAIAKFPSPAYTCKQFSSYDRKSTGADNPKTWFANGDANQYLRVERLTRAARNVKSGLWRMWMAQGRSCGSGRQTQRA
jgi:hypothetical protein